MQIAKPAIQIDAPLAPLVMAYQTIVNAPYVKTKTTDIQTVLNPVKIVHQVNITTITPVQIVQKDIIVLIIQKSNAQTVPIHQTLNHVLIQQILKQ